MIRLKGLGFEAQPTQAPSNLKADVETTGVKLWH